MRSQKEPGGARRSQEGSKIISAAARRCQEEPGGAGRKRKNHKWRSHEVPGGARETQSSQLEEPGEP
jgi:hypothetical protein